jgi:hypothetical protein
MGAAQVKYREKLARNLINLIFCHRLAHRS